MSREKLKIRKSDKRTRQTHIFFPSFLLFFSFSLFLPYIFVLILCVSIPASAQDDLPNEIRGYKVHRAKILVKNSADQNEQKTSDKKDLEAVVNLGEPRPTSVSISGVSFDISAEISAIEQSGKVDFLTFHDFRVNDTPVEIEEYRESFELSKNKVVRLPKPVKITVAYRHALFGVLEEQFNSKKYWQVTGRIFVFGNFKKGWFKFKRVVPVEINLQIRNPRIIGRD